MPHLNSDKVRREFGFGHIELRGQRGVQARLEECAYSREGYQDAVCAIQLTSKRGTRTAYFNHEEVEAIHEWLGELLAKRGPTAN